MIDFSCLDILSACANVQIFLRLRMLRKWLSSCPRLDSTRPPAYGLDDEDHLPDPITTTPAQSKSQNQQKSHLYLCSSYICQASGVNDFHMSKRVLDPTRYAGAKEILCSPRVRRSPHFVRAYTRRISKALTPTLAHVRFPRDPPNVSCLTPGAISDNCIASSIFLHQAECSLT